MVNRTSADVTGWPSCQVASWRSWNVHTEPLSSTVQRSARSGTTVPDGPFRTSPEKTSATRSRSACVRAVSGLTDEGCPRTPSRYGVTPRTAALALPPALGLARTCVDAAGISDGMPTRVATSANTTTSVPMTKVSVRVIGLRGRGPFAGAVPGEPWSGGWRGGRGQDEGREREDHEKNQQDDRELPQSALDATTAAVHSRIATE